ncbi:MAG: hypothetical protein ACYS8K_01665 [Planctomycetota bacterium]|jgi:hypothetical protein
MRGLIFLALSIAATVMSLVVCRPLREKAEEVLFNKSANAEASPVEFASAPEAVTDASAAGSPAQPVPEPPSDAEALEEPQDEDGQNVLATLWSNTQKFAAKRLQTDSSSLAMAGMTMTGSSEPRSEPASAQELPQQEGPTDSAEADPPEATPQADGPPPARVSQVLLPPALGRVRFGMSAARVARLYPVARADKEGRQRTLTCYTPGNGGQLMQFRFSSDSLHAIEVLLKPAEGQSAEQLREELRRQYATQYEDDADSPAVRWSDGTVTVSIEAIEDAVKVSFSCPPAKG